MYNNSTENPITLKKLHGNLGITSIKLKKVTPDGAVIETTGHDGASKTVLASQNYLRLIFTKRVPIKWIEKISGKLVFGFNDSHFACYRQDDGIVFETNCGGGHRMWDVFLDEIYGLFVFIQHKKLLSLSFTFYPKVRTSLRFPRINWHNDACNTAAILDSSILVSGGESNELKIHKITQTDVGEFTLKHLFSSRAHISSIKHLLTRLEDGTFLVISSGGRAQICVTRIQNGGDQVIEDTSYSLLSTDEQRVQNGLGQTVSSDPETRFTTAALSPDGSTLIMGCSDGYIRYFTLNLNSRPAAFSLIKEINYGRCLLNVTMVSNGYVLSMATDGYIVFWNDNPDPVPIAKLEHHQSGINCFDLFHDQARNMFIIATGGDDQAISISKFTIDENSVQVTITKSYKYLHTAQVTGIKFLNDNTILSAGVDQTVYKFQIEEDSDQPKVLWQYNTNVADIKGLSLSKDRDFVAIYGNGIEIKRLP